MSDKMLRNVVVAILLMVAVLGLDYLQIVNDYITMKFRIIGAGTILTFLLLAVSLCFMKLPGDREKKSERK